MAGGQPQGYPLPPDHLWCSNRNSGFASQAVRHVLTESSSAATGNLFVIQAYIQNCLKRVSWV